MPDETVCQAEHAQALDAGGGDVLDRLRAEPPTLASHELDLKKVFEWLRALERRVARLESLTEVVAAIGADVAEITVKLDVEPG
jgi:hypothetical protein